jgi:alpha-ketoglutaric semialdehyde dehydrogenase
MTNTLHGKNIIAGELRDSGIDSTQAVNPATGEQLEPEFIHATEAEVRQAAEQAEQAQEEILRRDSASRARLLRRMADEIMALGDPLIDRCHLETALPKGRLASERSRTVNQLRLFADLLQEGSWVDARIDTAIPDRTPNPRPNLRRMLIPIGPVAVFCASNFPLAFSVAGGDTASALAAGCPVIVKAHGSHPGTAELVASAVNRAIASERMPPGMFSLLHGPGKTVGTQLITHPLIKAAGFTGSRRAGRALFGAAASRPEPIPVYAEMGSINPVFLLPQALRERGDEIAKGLSASVTLGVGQFCTNPGLVVGLDSEELDSFIRQTGILFGEAPVETMLNARIHQAYHEGSNKLKAQEGVALSGQAGSVPDPDHLQGRPALFSSDGRTFLEFPLLGEEVFGPSSLVIRSQSREELLRIAAMLKGHLTASIHGSERDLLEYRDLTAVLQRNVGRLIFNGFPTGVEVCAAMNHGGPYPATTDSHFTSVGTAAIYRFARPICFQGFPEHVLAPELQDKNPLGILRQIDGRYTRDPVSS